MGHSSRPSNRATWTTGRLSCPGTSGRWGIVVDRDTYPGNIVKVTTYINGVKDGDPTLINFKGARLQGVANLTIGFGRDENGDPMTFRKDYNVPKPEWKRY